MANIPEDGYHHLAPDLRICRVLNGMWQVSGSHGPIEPRAAVRAMATYHDAGLTTWDLADHYGPAEDFVGTFRRQLAAERGEGALAEVQALTKWVPRPGPMTRRIVEDNVALSLRRMGVAALDLLQFHWWDYADRRYVEALKHLADLRTEGIISHLGLTNFDTVHLEGIVADGTPIVSNQVQYSLIDRRPEVRMAPFCAAQRIGLLTYGTLCGGLLAERYLGQPEPRQAALTTASLRKYKQMVDAWGGWELFQELLRVLKAIADRHGVPIATVAVRAILDRAAVAGVIVGTRLGVAEHIEDTLRVFDLRLAVADMDAIESVLAHSQDLYSLIGDCGAEYRR
jgi:aryl-alcohol dehydrogenase-like predicted oxidoreductase